MKKFLSALFVFLIAVSGFASGNDEQLKKEWVDKDEKIIRDALQFITTEDFSYNAIKKYMPSGPLVMNNEKLGFGLNKTGKGHPGGYLTIGYSYLEYDNLILSFKIEISTRNFDRIKDNLPSDLVKSVTKTFTKDENFYRFEYSFDDNYKEYIKHKESIVGKQKELSIPESYREYYKLLTAPTSNSVYGTMVGFAGTEPEENIAVRKLLELKNKDIFINILKGDNPAGRRYAADALLELESSQENINLINSIFDILRNEGVEYLEGEGCLMYIVPYPSVKYSKDSFSFY